MTDWVTICTLDDVEVEDVMRFDHGDRTFAVCRDDSGGVYVVDGLCTHEKVHLADGFVFGCILECPRHQGRFNLPNGRPSGGPVTEPVTTYETWVIDGMVLARLGN
jgi:3-phenylpropionate/trans-cinnamate dioxygenase ferredoxin subunit